jgi:hypothetical protein
VRKTVQKTFPGRCAGLRKALFATGFAVVLLGLACGHAGLLSRSPAWLVGIVADDGFYYLQIARHLAAGHGSTFDGIHPTSGYHPAWMALLVPLAAAVREPGSLLRGALALAFLLHAATALALVGLFRRWMTPGLAVIGSLCWLANPLALHLSFQGVESSLYALSLVLLLRAAAGFVSSATVPAALPPHLWLGGALALCFLSRTEAGLLALVTCAVAPALRGSPLRSWSYLRSVLLVAATFVLCVLPWFVYCWAATGSPWQGSGVAKALWARQFLDPLSTAGRLSRAADVVGHAWLIAPWVGTQGSPFEGINAFVYVAMAPAALGLLLAARRPLAHLPLIAWSAWLLGATLLTGGVYGLFYWDTPVWYRTQPALLLFVITFAWIARAGIVLEGRRWGAVFGTGAPLLLLAFSLLKAGSLYRNPLISYPWQRDFYASQAGFERLVPPGEAIACFNAGIPAFFSRRRIVNLDGLVNASVVPYLRARDLERYFSDENLHYIADDTLAMDRAERFMSRPLRLQPLASVPLHGWFATRRWLWRVTEPRSPHSVAPAGSSFPGG